jgi:hypothetical protein
MQSVAGSVYASLMPNRDTKESAIIILGYYRRFAFCLLQKKSFHAKADDFIPYAKIRSIGSEITRLDMKSSPLERGLIFSLNE